MVTKADVIFVRDEYKIRLVIDGKFWFKFQQVDAYNFIILDCSKKKHIGNMYPIKALNNQQETPLTPLLEALF